MAVSQDISGALTGAAAGAAVGGPVGAGIGGVAGLLGGLFSGNDDAEQAQQNIQNALAQLTAVGVPPDLAKPLILQQLQQGGTLTPAYEQALSSDNLQASQIQENPSDKNDQLATLSALKGMSSGGLNPSQMAAAQQLQSNTNANTQSQIKSLLQRGQMQGTGDNGNAQAAALSAIQGGAQDQSQAAANIGAQGFQQQAQALQQLLAGQGNVRSQDLSTLSQNAQLQQQANLWKAQNSAARQARNVGSENAANEANWQRGNQVSDTNTLMNNQEQQREVAAQQQQWADQLGLAQSKANAYTGAANSEASMANNANNSFNSMLQGVTGLAGAYAGYKNAPGQTTTTTPTATTAIPSTPNYGTYNGGSSGLGSYDLSSPGTNYSSGGYNGLNGLGPYNYAKGGTIPGIAPYKGNTIKNDIVPVMATSGEIIIPHTLTNDPKAATKFLMDEIDKQHAQAGPLFLKLHQRLSKLENRKKV